jgi:L-fucose mutarotase/ribose pyranase (RbsD/FucU family)
MSDNAHSATANWERRLEEIIPLFGHRNWIVVADAAYPAQSSTGIETIVTSADQIHVLRTVIDAIAASNHIKANVYLDYELHFIHEKDASGVENYKHELEVLLQDSTLFRLPHEQIIQKLDHSAHIFKILILKTQMTIPYTSVFFELDCGYWNAEAEERLRDAIMAAHARKS